MNIGTSVVVLGTAAFPERVAGHIGTVTDEEETHVRMIGPGRMVKVRIDDEIDMGFGDVYPAGYVVMGFSVDELTDMTSTAPHPDPKEAAMRADPPWYIRYANWLERKVLRRG